MKRSTTDPRLRRFRAPWLTLTSMFVYVFLFAPIAILAFFSFNKAKSGARFTGFSTRWYHSMLNNAQLKEAFGTSINVAIITTVASVFLGTLAAFAIARTSMRGKGLLTGLLLIPLVMPEVVMGISLLVFFLRLLGIQLSLLTVVIAHTTFCLAYVEAVVRSRFLELDPKLEEAAADLGAKPLATFRTVVLPLAMPGIIAGAILAFTLSFDEVVVTFFTSGPGSTTLPLYVWGQLKLGVSPEINALSTVIMAVSITLITVMTVVFRKVESLKRHSSGSTLLGS